MSESEIQEFLSRQTRHAAIADAARIEEQARIFVRMGYDVQELVLVRFITDPGWQYNVVPISAISGYINDA